MKYVLTYASADPFDPAAAREHFPAHRARWDAFREQETLLLIGPFADPALGAMAVFTTQQAAEEFAASDPFVLHGVISSWRVTCWNEALLDPI